MNIDKSLEEIQKEKRQQQKRKPKPKTQSNNNTSTSQSQLDSGSKVIVANLDFQVTEADLKELFATIGPLKKVSLSFDASGKSKGQAEVHFVRKNDALQAVKKYDGVQLDKRPMHLSVLARVSSSVRVPISERLGAPLGGENKRQGVKNNRAKKNSRSRSRGQKKEEKTAEQMDAELDSFVKKEETAPAVADVTMQS